MNDVSGSASLYIRLSREARDSNTSLEGMETDCRALAANLGLEVYAVHVDNGLSGAVRNRPEFVAWLNDARQGHVGTLIASHSDRLTREGVNAAGLVFDVVEGKDPVSGAVVRQPTRLATVDGLDSQRDPDGFRWRFLVEAEVARGERQSIVRRNKATKQRLRAAGRFPGGAIPFGCQVVERVDPMADGKVGKFLERDDAEAKILEEVAARLLRGDSVRSTVRWLNIEGHKTRRGYEWQRTTLVSTLLSAPSRAHVFNPATYNELSVRLQPKKNGVQKHNGGRPAAHLLVSGIGRCGGCGGTVTTAGGRSKILQAVKAEVIERDGAVCVSCGEQGVKVGRGDGVSIDADMSDAANLEAQCRDHYRGEGTHHPTRYTCMAKSKGGVCPGGATINAAACDEEVERRFLERYGDEPYVEIRTVLMGGEELEEAKAADTAAQAALSENLTAENFAAAQEARARLEARQAQPIQRTDTLHLTGLTVGQTWAAANLEGRRAMLSEHLAEPVRLMPGKPKQGPGRGKVVNLDRIQTEWRIDQPA